MIADDHSLVREGIKRVAEKYPDLEIVSEAVDDIEIKRLLKQHPIDLLILDISMPGPGFMTIMKYVEIHYPDIKILVQSVHSEDIYATQALKAGAKGYIEKSRAPEELHKAICQIFKGKRYISSRLKERLFQDTDIGIERTLHATLSNRELQILIYIGEGKKLREIADELSLSPKTVSTYRSRVLTKMGFKHNNELIRYAISNDLVC